MTIAAGAPPAPRSLLRPILRVVGDVALYAAGFLFAALATANIPGTTLREGDSLQITHAGIAIYLLCALAWVSVFFRRRAPLAPLIAGMLLTVIGTEYLLLLIGAHGVLVRWPQHRRRSLVLLVSALIIAFSLRELLTPWADAGPISIALQGVDANGRMIATWIMTFAVAALSLLISFGSAALVRTRRESRAHQGRADQESDRAAALSSELDRQSERDRLARDIHDALAHRLSVISLQSGALEEASRSQDASVARAALTLRQQAHASLEDLRGLLGELRSERQKDGDDSSVPPSMASMRTIGHLIRSVREGGTVVDAFVLIEGAENAGAALDRTTYRIVQESLTNALKHAPGAPVAVYVEASPARTVRIRVSNPILPASVKTAPGSGRGTAGIRERAHLLDGTAWVGEAEGQFIVDVTLPWPESD